MIQILLPLILICNTCLVEIEPFEHCQTTLKTPKITLTSDSLRPEYGYLIINKNLLYDKESQPKNTYVEDKTPYNHLLLLDIPLGIFANPPSHYWGMSYQYNFSGTWSGSIFITRFKDSVIDESGYSIRYSSWEVYPAAKWYWKNQSPYGGYLKFGAVYSGGNIDIANPETHSRVSEWGSIIGAGYSTVENGIAGDFGFHFILRNKDSEWHSSTDEGYSLRKFELGFVTSIGISF